MGYIDYNRYSILSNGDGTYESMPFIDLPINKSDKYEYWNKETSRLDKISLKYYGNPLYDFFILYANPEYISEFDIPDSKLIRIPFPLAKVRADFEAILNKYKNQ